jgi:hypothetical protein
MTITKKWLLERLSDVPDTTEIRLESFNHAFNELTELEIVKVTKTSEYVTFDICAKAEDSGDESLAPH